MLAAISCLAGSISGWRTSYVLGLQDVELRYKRSVLGPFWISASLVALVLALALVFVDVFQEEFAQYISFVGAGMLAWQLLTALINEGCNAVVEHSTFLQNIRLPINVIAGRLAVRNAIAFAHNFLAIGLLLLFFGWTLTPMAVLALPGALAILIFGFFLSMTFGPLSARYRDIPLVVQNGLQVVFFLTPIFWMPNTMSHRPMLAEANPLYHMVEVVRAPILGQPATAANWQVVLLCCASAALLAMATTTLTQKRLALWL